MVDVVHVLRLAPDAVLGVEEAGQLPAAASMEKGQSQELNLILKGDVSGSLEALEDSLAKIDVGDEVSLRVIDRGVGAITETNVDLAAASDVVDGCVVRQPKAYPVYDDGYAQNVDLIRREIAARFPTLHLVGRNGMHKYNNQDHSMLTAMRAVDCLAGDGTRKSDIWDVNAESSYHEAR